MTRSPVLLVLLFASLFSIACSDATSSDAAGPAASSTGGGGSGTGGAGDGGDGGGTSATSSPLRVASYPDDGGKLLLVPISVNGSAPFDVLLDTGSNGLRVFADALGGTPVDVGTEPISVEFGGGNTMAGHLATAELAFGDVPTDGPVAFHLVEAFECAAWNPACDFASGSASFFTDIGVQGILGVSGRPGMPAELYSPFAQLGEPLSNGFVLHTGGFDSMQGEIRFGLDAAATEGFAQMDLPPKGTLPNGMPAWADDDLSICFAANGEPFDPECTAGVFDTGSSAEIVYGPNLAPALVDNGILAPGVTFAATMEPAFHLELTVGATPTPGVDLVLVDTSQPFAILGLGVFLRNDVLFDFAGGRIGFRPL